MGGILIQNALVGGQKTDIRIAKGRIVALEPVSSPLPGEQVLDAAGGLAVPGLVDCHAHIDKSHLNDKLRTSYVHGTGPQKGALTREEKAKFTVADITERAEQVISRAIESGTLILRTNCDVDAIVGLKGIEALLSLREKYRDRLQLQIAAFSQEGIFQDGKTPALLEEALKMGADLLGGHTIAAGEGESHIDFILKLAEKYDVEVDFHLDESGNREHYLLPYLAQKIHELGYEGRVNAIHMCTLSALNDAELREAMELIRGSGLKVTIAPTAISTRKIAPVKAILETGALVGLGSDNIRDFFNPLGCGDIKQMAQLLSYLQAFYTREENEAIWSMITHGGAKLLGVEYGLVPGARADVTVFPAETALEVIAGQLQPSLLVRSGALL